ncbi:MAG: hypothetical protein M3O93_07025 [Chloroflexota bacterium]|nr:hypothetical protein [Chloroflexota bacterium]
MFNDAPPIRVTLSHDYPTADEVRPPPQIPSDSGRQSDLAVQARDQVLQICDRRLELDDEEHARCGEPRQDIDRSPLAKDRERDLGPACPPQSRQETYDRRRESRVRRVEEPIQVPASPAGPKVETNLKRRQTAAQHSDTHLLDQTALQARNRRYGAVGGASDVALPPAAPDSNRANGPTKAQVVHPLSMPSAA